MVISKWSITSQLAFLKRQLSSLKLESSANLVSQALWIILNDNLDFQPSEPKRITLCLEKLLSAPSVEVDWSSFEFTLDAEDVVPTSPTSPSQSLELDTFEVLRSDLPFGTHADPGNSIDEVIDCNAEATALSATGSGCGDSLAAIVERSLGDGFRGLGEQVDKLSSKVAMVESSERMDKLEQELARLQARLDGVCDARHGPCVDSGTLSSPSHFELGEYVEVLGGTRRSTQKHYGYIVGFTRHGKMGVAHVDSSGCSFCDIASLRSAPRPARIRDVDVHSKISACRRLCRNVFVEVDSCIPLEAFQSVPTSSSSLCDPAHVDLDMEDISFDPISADSSPTPEVGEMVIQGTSFRIVRNWREFVPGATTDDMALAVHFDPETDVLERPRRIYSGLGMSEILCFWIAYPDFSRLRRALECYKDFCARDPPAGLLELWRTSKCFLSGRDDAETLLALIS